MTDPANPSEGGPPKQPAAIASARHPGHELPLPLPFAAPSTFLQLRAPVANRPTASSHSRTEHSLAAEKPLMTPLDKEQMQGLVSLPEPLDRGTCSSAPLFPFHLRLPGLPWSDALIPHMPLVPRLRGHWPAASTAGSIQRGSTSSRSLCEGAGYCRRA